MYLQHIVDLYLKLGDHHCYAYTTSDDILNISGKIKIYIYTEHQHLIECVPTYVYWTIV